jgi:hypothetical protein
MLRHVFLLGLCFTAPLAAAEAPDALDFARHVQPILAAKCIKCHGPATAEAGLALDTRERALALPESGTAAIVPSRPEASRLLERVTATDAEHRMPPEGKPLTAQEVETLRRWIREGAEWSQPWAFRPIAQPPVPKVKQATWVRNEIDAFILRGLEQAGIEPNPMADRRTLVRRAYYTLLGLPPTAEQVEAFVNDPSPQAWEKLIDQLLASPHYGEYWARKWLDVVRYAETNSFERDNPKPHVWRYRDYVIRAFNDNKPYDAFLREQLAGDELPHPSADQLIATGFYRLGVWDDEPADRELALYDGYDDLITTVGQGLLGLTLNCARCHDHKIDPIRQSDYYQLLTFFRHILPMETGGPNIEESLFASPAARTQYEAAERDRQEQLAVAEKEVARLEEIFRLMIAGEQNASHSSLQNVKYQLFRKSFDLLPDFSQLKADAEGTIPSQLFDIAIAQSDREFAFVFTGELRIDVDGEYRFELDSDDGSRLWVDGEKRLTYDGIHGVGEPKTVQMKLKQGMVPLRLEYFQRHHGLGLSLVVIGPGGQRRRLTPDTLPIPKNDKQVAKLMQQRGRAVLGDDEFAKYQTALEHIRELKQERPIDKALVVKERGANNVPEVFVLLRGTPGNLGAKVSPGFPTILAPPEPHIVPRERSTGRRTALAEWITSPENRLTARVFVNRVWQGQFGRGIVRSTNNFGGLGTPPTHPELLDYLAADFVAHGWDVKRLQKMIMLSQTWQMAASGQPDGLARDPANDLFWRYDMRRLSAEEVRDTLLVASGTLNRQQFGPSIYPKIQAEVLAGQSRPGSGWGKSTPEQAARRSVYIHVKRSLVTPLLASFDFPETDVSCEARFVTTQPGQSFALLNGAFANEQAQLFAARLRQEIPSGNEPQMIAAAYRIALGREVRAEEQALAKRLLTSLREEHGLSAENALQQFALFMLNLNEFLYLD